MKKRVRRELPVEKVKRPVGRPRKDTSIVKPPMPRNYYIINDLVRISEYAGAGKSAGEISSFMGGTTRNRILALVSEYEIRLIPKGPGEAICRARLKRRLMELIEAKAFNADVEVMSLFGAIIEEAYADPELIDRAVNKLARSA